MRWEKNKLYFHAGVNIVRMSVNRTSCSLSGFDWEKVLVCIEMCIGFESIVDVGEFSLMYSSVRKSADM
jgi:hypothetical protein